ncbi:hypothetical protein CR513_60832, partial [Mucuna pruriens]
MLIKLAPLPGTQVPLCLCVPKLSKAESRVRGMLCLSVELESSSDPLYDLDPEIEITLRRLRKGRNIVVSNSNSSNFISSFDNTSPVTNNSDSFEYSSANNSVELEQMEKNDRTLKELAMLDVLEPAQTYELKSGLIHLLPKFHVVCSTMKPQEISEDYIKMKAFPFSLDEAMKDWLYLQMVLFNTWGDMKCMFLEKFFSASRTATIRKEICEIR